MHRLFVALRPPPPLRAYLTARMGGVAHARWQSDDQLHLTLRFLGEVDRSRAEEVAGALRTIDRPRPSIAIDGVGSFGRDRGITSIWARVAPDPALIRLHDRIERVLIRLGLGAEPRVFRPHITLARLSAGAGVPPAALAPLAGLAFDPVTVDQVLLFESTVGPTGAHYDVVARYPLV
jgi:2'-5' RNA ligase